MKRLLLLCLMVFGMVAFAQMGEMVTPSLSVSDQATSDYSVTIDSVTLAEDGFVVVHAYDANDELVLTPPLGLVYLEAGTHENVTVTLEPGLLAEYGYIQGSKNVLPMVHVDANANGTYEFPEGSDVPVTVNGEMVVASLALSPSLHVFDQTLNGANLTIDNATLAEDGFIVVHAFDQNGELVLTPPLGLTHLDAGIHDYVTIELDQALLEQYGYTTEGAKNVLPMIHVDANGNGSYEFPEGPDVPVMVAGEMVTAAISLSDAAMTAPMVNVEGDVALEVDGEGLYVNIPTVTLAQPGFVVLHSVDQNGELVVTPALGSSAFLTAGSHGDVTIRIDATATPVVGDMVHAMLHVDDGNMTYTFPNSDAPVTMDGGIVMQAFELQ